MLKEIGYAKEAVKKLGKKKVEKLRKKKGMPPLKKDFYMMAKKSGKR